MLKCIFSIARQNLFPIAVIFTKKNIISACINIKLKCYYSKELNISVITILTRLKKNLSMLSSKTYFMFSKSVLRRMKSESLYYCCLLSYRIYTICTRSSRKMANADILQHVMQQTATGCISRCIHRKLFCKEVIEENSIFPRRLISPWLRLQSCGLLSSFFMFSLFDVVFFGGASHSILELARNTVRNAYHFTNFLFTPAAPLLNAAWRRVLHSVQVKHKTRRSTCDSVRTD